MDKKAFWLENLKKYQTVDLLRRSAFFAAHGEEIESYLKTPHVARFPDAVPRLTSFLRIAQWNIEKGKRLSAILDLLQNDDVLRWADIILLNECDYGMNRSGNGHVARIAAESLGMHMVFGAAHFELTKGTDDELNLKGENTDSIQGNAILSRYPITGARVVPLPVTFEPYEFREKRFGWRNCLWAQVDIDGFPVWVGTTHLELRNTPQCRARQMKHILKNLPGTAGDAFLFGGDLNTNSFGRGTTWRTIKSASRLIFASPPAVKRSLLRPEQGWEPLFEYMELDGFLWEGLNSNEETARTAIDSLEESGFLPDPVVKLINRRLEPYDGFLCFKLDWLFGKNVRALKTGQKSDPEAGVQSASPGLVKFRNSGSDRISDHLPIYADIDLA